jgi:hypothetical protein
MMRPDPIRGNDPTDARSNAASPAPRVYADEPFIKKALYLYCLMGTRGVYQAQDHD